MTTVKLGICVLVVSMIAVSSCGSDQDNRTYFREDTFRGSPSYSAPAETDPSIADICISFFEALYLEDPMQISVEPRARTLIFTRESGPNPGIIAEVPEARTFVEAVEELVELRIQEISPAEASCSGTRFTSISATNEQEIVVRLTDEFACISGELVYNCVVNESATLTD